MRIQETVDTAGKWTSGNGNFFAWVENNKPCLSIFHHWVGYIYMMYIYIYVYYIIYVYWCILYIIYLKWLDNARYTPGWWRHVHSFHPSKWEGFETDIASTDPMLWQLTDGLPNVSRRKPNDKWCGQVFKNTVYIRYLYAPVTMSNVFRQPKCRQMMMNMICNDM
jgi:hypothetical protein